VSTSLSSLKPIVRLFLTARRRGLLLGTALSATTVSAGIALLGLSGWFITATGIAGLSAATIAAFDIFMPSAGIRLLALGRTASRYGERLASRWVDAARSADTNGWPSSTASNSCARIMVLPVRLEKARRVRLGDEGLDEPHGLRLRDLREAVHRVAQALPSQRVSVRPL